MLNPEIITLLQHKFEVLCQHTPGAPEFIETREDEVLAAPGMIKLVKENNDKYDAFIIAGTAIPTWMSSKKSPINLSSESERPR